MLNNEAGGSKVKVNVKPSWTTLKNVDGKQAMTAFLHGPMVYEVSDRRGYLSIFLVDFKISPGVMWK